MINNVEDIIVFLALKVFGSNNVNIFPADGSRFCRETEIKKKKI